MLFPTIRRLALIGLPLTVAGLAMGAMRRRLEDAEARARVAEAGLVETTKAAARLRHDLRGILSPALLTADRLSGSQDPLARRTAETMIATVERAERRLREK